MQSIGFSADIKPLFREKDRTAMMHRFDLWSYDDVVKNAPAILAAVAAGQMPCDGGWPPEQVETLKSWIAGGTQP